MPCPTSQTQSSVSSSFSVSSSSRHAFSLAKAPSLLSATVLIGALSTVGVSSGCKPKDDAKDQAPKEKKVVEVPVRTAVLEPTTFVDSVRVQGLLEANESVRITAEIPGRIEGLPFHEGQRVGRGQTVVRLGARSASAQVAQAQANADLAISQHRRQKALAAKNLATQQAVEMAAAQMAQAVATLELMQANLDKAVIRSPIEGVVSELSVSRGEVANPGAPLIEIVDVTKVKVVAQVPERDVALLREGTAVDVSVDALDGRTFPGIIRRVGLTANASTRTFPLEIEVENKDQQLRPGMLAYLSVVRRTYDAAVVVPRDAVLDDIENKSVFVVESGKARRRPVELGPVKGALALVRTGLNIGDELIVLGHHQVVDGQPIRVDSKTTCCKPAPTSDTDGAASAGGEADPAPDATVKGKQSAAAKTGARDG